MVGSICVLMKHLSEDAFGPWNSSACTFTSFEQSLAWFWPRQGVLYQTAVTYDRAWTVLSSPHTKVSRSVWTAGGVCSMQVFVPGKISMLVQLRCLNTQMAKEEPETALQNFDVAISLWLLREIWQYLADITMRLQFPFLWSPVILIPLLARVLLSFCKLKGRPMEQSFPDV